MATRPPSSRLDRTDRALLLALSKDGRRPAADLAKELGLSRQAVTERIRDLERRGVIRGYRADVDPAALGLSLRAHLRLTLDGRAPANQEKERPRRLTASPVVGSGHRVSGEDCVGAQVLGRRIEDVSALLDELKATRAVQSSRTSFVLETVMERGGLGTLEAPMLPE